MRRTLVLSAVIGVFAAGVGCKQVGGRCDCSHAPADAHLPGPGMAYPTIGSPTVGVTPVPPASTAPAAVAPAPGGSTPEKMPAPK